jgi:hypothetical protein
MTSTGTWLAIFLGSKNNPRMTEWMARPETDRKAKEQKGIAAWKAWVEKHEASIVNVGGPLGRTMRVSRSGIEAVANELGAFTVVRAESHEAAARLFENHPHFTIFPGEAVEVMPILTIPGN